MSKTKYCALIVIIICLSIFVYTLEISASNNQGEGEDLKKTEDKSGVGDIKTETIMLPGDVPLEMIWIPSGTFMMGAHDEELACDHDESPQHKVTITSGFWIGKYELTKKQWVAIMESTPWSGKGQVSKDDNSPAVFVSWTDVRLFINKLNRLFEDKTSQKDKEFRLPTEAEWEYACRAGTTTRFYWGDDPDYMIIKDYAWWRGNVWSSKKRYAHIVGQKTPNAWGLYDMSGNVWEWCADWYGVYSSLAQKDPAGPDSGSSRIMRGGCWLNNGNHLRSANRDYRGRKTRSSIIGFRIAWGFLQDESD